MNSQQVPLQTIQKFLKIQQINPPLKLTSSHFSCLYGETLALSKPTAIEIDQFILGQRDLKNKRRIEFAVGQYCAENACLLLDPSISIAGEISRQPDRSPVWPKGMVGSITHSQDFASAAVGWGSQYRGIGIDTENIIDKKVGEEIGPTISTYAELKLFKEWDYCLAYTLLFSAKESAYKCVYPTLNTLMSFKDFELISINKNIDSFSILVKVAGCKINLIGQFYIEGNRVHTGVTWTNL